MKTSNQKLISNTLARFIRFSFLGISSAALIACGGGGGSEDSKASEQPPTPSNKATESYQPNSERLLEKATNSEELYVEQDFNFERIQFTQLNISLVNSEGEELSFTRLNIYLLDTSDKSSIPTEWSDDLVKTAHLLSGGITDSKGKFTRIIDIPRTHQNETLLLIEVNAIGFENKALITVTGEQTYITMGAI